MSSPTSLSKFQGLPWEAWTNALGRTSPIADKPPEPIPLEKNKGCVTKLPKEAEKILCKECSKLAVEKNKGCVTKLPKDDLKTYGASPEKDPFTAIVCEVCNIMIKPQPLLHHFADKLPEPTLVEKNKGYVTKLPKEDMKTYGLCPEKDPFSAILCEICNVVVKPQALLQHYETRHSDSPSDITNQSVQVSTEVVASDKIKIKPKVKTNSKKTTSKDSKGREGVVNPPPSLPVSLTLEAPIGEPGSSQGESLQPIVALTPLTGASPAAPISVPAVVKPPRRPPRKHAPIKEREYDPDKHCGVITAETMKPCTWSLTCKSHPMSLRRAVTGRSKPFDQLLADHRQAKEALIQAKKKNLEQQNAAASNTQTTVQPSVVPVVHQHHKPAKVEKINLVDPAPTVVQRLPELCLDVTSGFSLLSSVPSSLIVGGGDKDRPPPPPPAAASAPAPAPVVPTATTTPQTDAVTYTFTYPRPLGISSMFSTHKIGGLVYTNRRMQIARQGLESCLNRAGNGIYLTTHRGDHYQTSSLSNVLNHVSSRAALNKKRTKADKPNRPNKKVCLSKDSSLHDIQINNLKSVLARQYPNTQSRLIGSSTDPTFHIPNILSSVLKRPTDAPSKIPKKPKKKTPPVNTPVLSNHSKNGLTGAKGSSYVRAVVNGKHESEGLEETSKFNNSNKILNEADIRKIGLRFEIFD